MAYDVVAILACDGSPTCGSSLSSYCEDWGGRPKEVPRILVNKPGIFIEELAAEVADRHLKLPFIYGLAMDARDKSNEQIIQEFRDFIDNRLAREKGTR